LSADVPKVPRLFQDRLDHLIDKSKLGRLTEDEDRQLREAIEYLDRLKVYAMSRVLQRRARRTVVGRRCVRGSRVRVRVEDGQAELRDLGCWCRAGFSLAAP